MNLNERIYHEPPSNPYLDRLKSIQRQANKISSTELQEELRDLKLRMEVAFEHEANMRAFDEEMANLEKRIADFQNPNETLGFSIDSNAFEEKAQETLMESLESVKTSDPELQQKLTSLRGNIKVLYENGILAPSLNIIQSQIDDIRNQAFTKANEQKAEQNKRMELSEQQQKELRKKIQGL